ncbi:MAG: RNA 2',3'-cyclic phosphodiesterase [Thermodesulfobacteriota bacterium]
MRTFIAIELDDSLAGKVRDMQDKLQSQLDGVRWVAPGSVHLTLKFLGEINEQMIEEVSRQLDAVASDKGAFSLRPKGAGAFPDLRRPRVIILAAGEGSEQVAGLEKDISSRLENIGFPRGRRPFSPHFTLGRIKRWNARLDLAKLLEPFADYVFDPFKVEEFILFRSELRPEGARYTKLARFLFKANLLG